MFMLFFCTLTEAFERVVPVVFFRQFSCSAGLKPFVFVLLILSIFLFNLLFYFIIITSKYVNLCHFVYSLHFLPSNKKS